MNSGRFPPLSHTPLVHVSRRRLTLQTTAGRVVLKVCYGKDLFLERYLSPVHVAWGLGEHEKMSPELEDRLCFTATQTSSYEKAAAVAEKFGCPVSDSVIHAHAQKRGAQALEAESKRVKDVEWPATREQISKIAKEIQASWPFDLIIMMDGWMNRQRGPDWAKKPPEAPGARVEWHEIKTAVIFRLDHQARSAGGRGMVIEKFVVCHQGDPWEFCRRTYAEAVRRGLDQARRVYFVADGGKWIWQLKKEKFPWAIGVLDFYHGAQHLWALAAALAGGGGAPQRSLAEPLLDQLYNGQEQKMLQTLEELLAGLDSGVSAEARRIIEREVAYFQSHREDLAYKKRREEGCPNGSGTMESTCAQLQGRFKCPGQFWTLTGKDRLMALETARRNNDWDDFWMLAA